MGGIQQVGMPELYARAGIRVEGIDTVMLSRHKDDVVYIFAKTKTRHPERLGVDSPVEGTGEKLPECGCVDVGGCEDVLLGVRTVAYKIIVIGVNARQIYRNAGRGALVCVSHTGGCNRVCSAA